MSWETSITAPRIAFSTLAFPDADLATTVSLGRTWGYAGVEPRDRRARGGAPPAPGGAWHLDRSAGLTPRSATAACAQTEKPRLPASREPWREVICGSVAGAHAAVHVEDLAGDEGGVLQVDDCLGDVTRLAH